MSGILSKILSQECLHRNDIQNYYSSFTPKAIKSHVVALFAHIVSLQSPVWQRLKRSKQPKGRVFQAAGIGLYNNPSITSVPSFTMVRKHRARYRRSIWVHKVLRTRHLLGEFHRLFQELRFDGAWFQHYFQLDKSQFNDLLPKVGPRINKIDTNQRLAIGPSERLAICLR